MFLSGKFYAAQLSGLFLSGLIASNCVAQPGYDDPNVGLKYNQRTFSNQFPCAECAVYDNNGNDLRGFINSKKADFAVKAAAVNDYSGGNWGYLQVKNAKVPSLDREGNLNYYQAFDVTLALYQSAGSTKSTWWARQTNSPKGPLVHMKVDDKDKLGMDDTRYTAMLTEMESKKMTLVEYCSDIYNQVDYDELFKNCLLMKSGDIKDVSGYKKLIDYYNGFLDKFSSVSDPFLEHKSFVTFLSINGTRYVGYFNIVNSKLDGTLEVADIQYEKDREAIVNRVFGKLAGYVVYVYGNDSFGLDKAIITYGHAHNMRLIRRKATDAAKFNDHG